MIVPPMGAFYLKYNMSKINELKIQCGSVWIGEHVMNTKNGKYEFVPQYRTDDSALNIDKFTKSIINECANVCKGMEMRECGYDDAPENYVAGYGLGYYDGKIDASIEIKDYFK